ncbi:hypothetical protein GCM10009576_041400 [Streptomyces rhizosphaericus]|uniref:Uncharacterized protein n=2 Tax=Streptomyces TaxID=1883 RepID=A0ABN1SBI3_9ACTN
MASSEPAHAASSVSTTVQKPTPPGTGAHQSGTSKSDGEHGEHEENGEHENQSDGPGGHADPSAKTNHEFQGKE